MQGKFSIRYPNSDTEIYVNQSTTEAVQFVSNQGNLFDDKWTYSTEYGEATNFTTGLDERSFVLTLKGNRSDVKSKIKELMSQFALSRETQAPLTLRVEGANFTAYYLPFYVVGCTPITDAGRVVALNITIVSAYAGGWLKSFPSQNAPINKETTTIKSYGDIFFEMVIQITTGVPTKLTLSFGKVYNSAGAMYSPSFYGSTEQENTLTANFNFPSANNINTIYISVMPWGVTMRDQNDNDLLQYFSLGDYLQKVGGSEYDFATQSVKWTATGSATINGNARIYYYHQGGAPLEAFS